MDDDLATKRIKTEGTGSDAGRRSRLNDPRAVRQGLISLSPAELPEASNISSAVHHRRDDSAIHATHGKENIDPCHLLEGHLDEPPESTYHEDGYMSPPPSYFRLATPDLSSPAGRPFRASPRKHGSMDDFGADIISSPLGTKRRSPWFDDGNVSSRTVGGLGNVLVPGTPPLTGKNVGGPDLKDILSVCSTDEIEELEDPAISKSTTPPHESEIISTDTTISEDPVTDSGARASRLHAVANGWWNKWAMKQEAHVSDLMACLSKYMLTLSRNYLCLDVLRQPSLLKADNRGNGLGHGLRHRTPWDVLTSITRLQTPEKPWISPGKLAGLMRDMRAEARCQQPG